MARVESTVPEEFRICTVSVSKAVVVLVSALSMCRKNESVAAVAACRDRYLLQRRVRVRGAIAIHPCVPAARVRRFAGGIVDHAGGQGPGRGICRPIFKSGIAQDLRGRAASEVTVSETVVLWETPPPLALIVTVEVPVVAVLLAVKVSVELPEPARQSMPD